MARKVIYVSWMPLTAKVSRDWFIDYLISKEMPVEYWDVTYLLRGELNQTDAISTDYSTAFRTYSEVEKKIQENRDALFVMLVSYDGRRASFYRLFSKYGCRMMYINWGAMPVIHGKNIFQKILSRLENPLKFAEDVLFKIKGYVFRRLKLVKPYEIVFAAGGQSLMANNYSSKVIPINLCDFDNYRKAASEAGQPVEGVYAVYLDIHLPFQSDLEVCGMRAVTPSSYYASLNRFFGLIEEQYKLKVIIAAHPKANYNSNIFNGREIYSGQTPELVKNADFVIVEASTSISYAVLNHKPIVSIYTEEMSSLYRNSFMRDIKDASIALGSTLYNVDRVLPSEHIHIGDVDYEKYDRYKYQYLTTIESEESKSNEIFFSAMVGLCGTPTHP